MNTAAYFMIGVNGNKRNDRKSTTRSAVAAKSWLVGYLFRAREDRTFLEKLVFESRKVKVATAAGLPAPSCDWFLQKNQTRCFLTSRSRANRTPYPPAGRALKIASTSVARLYSSTNLERGTGRRDSRGWARLPPRGTSRQQKGSLLHRA